MNEFNIKYCDFKKHFFIDFLDELGLFIEEKPVFTKKKNLRRSAVCRDFMAVQMKFCPHDF
jgi:hypothetical protein